MKPLVSILIPHYNYIQFVPFAIDSALQQTYPNVEVVVTDNQSTDGAVPILRERYRDEPRVRIIENERNLGMTGNFNRALEHARGEYVLWLSSDDFMFAPHVERLQAVFEREPAIDVVYSGCYFADEAGRVFSIRSLPGQFPVDYVDARDELVEQVTTVCPLCLPTALFPRALLAEVGPMDDDEFMAADWEYAIRIAALGKRFAYLAEPSVCVRLHREQRSGAEYHTTGRNVVDFVGYLTKFIDHECMRRLRGREHNIIRLIDGMRSDVLARNNSANPFAPEAEARFTRLRERLVELAEQRTPAEVRSNRISVIIPAIGPPQGTLGAIQSVVEQTFPDVELVVVDHGAFPIENVLRSHPAWSRMRYLRHPAQLAPGAANNFGLRMASGEYIAVLDPNNRFAPHHLDSLADVVQHTGAEAAAAPARLIIDRASPQFVLFEQLGEADIFRSERDPVEVSVIANSLPLDAVLFHRAINQRIGRFNETLPILEDFDFLIRLEQTTKIVWSQSPTAFVHMRLGFAGQLLATKLPHYLNMLEAIYRAYPVAAELNPLREVHRNSVARTLANVNENATSPQGIAGFVAALAGRSVVRAPALS